MNNIAIIPARSGSKGVKDKNIKEICGLPLIAYTIDNALKSKCFNKVFVSTDSPKYAEIAEKYGADASFLRSEYTSGDTAGTWDVVKEVMKTFEERNEHYDNIMLLQPTSPLRTEIDIQASFSLMEEKGANSVISVTEMEYSPLWCNTLKDDLSMEHFQDPRWINVPRQKIPQYYRLNGAVYLLKREELEKKVMFRKKSYAYVMPGERSIDIDTELDFKIAEFLLMNMTKNWNKN